MKKLLIGSLGFLIPNASFAYTSSQKEVKCPVDGKAFTITVTNSYTTFGSMTDFQQYGAIGNLYEVMISSCPACHYSGYENDFDTTFTNTTKEEILKILLPYKEVQMNDVIECEIAA